ncbi:MAG: hypothetical protein U0821_08595 [Chloroflexota bacterium]
MRICIAPISQDRPFSLSRWGVVSSEIYFEHNGQAYPEVGWIDMSSALLGVWGVSVRELAMGRTRWVSLRFMEGPFGLFLCLMNNGKVEIAALRAAMAWDVPIGELVAAVRDAYRELADYCESWGLAEQAATLRQRSAGLDDIPPDAWRNVLGPSDL